MGWIILIIVVLIVLSAFGDAIGDAVNGIGCAFLILMFIIGTMFTRGCGG